MSSHIWKCSQCNKQEKIYLKDGIINTNCQCGYYSNMSIKEFIKIYKRDKSHNIINNDTFKDITTRITEANEHLLNYCKVIKDEHMRRLIDLMNRVESTYEESYNRNKDMLTFLEILIDNYDGSIEMKNNILNYTLNIYHCKDRKNIDEVIKYYKEYNIIEKKRLMK